MTALLKFELKQNFKSWFIWTLSIVLLNVMMMSVFSTMRQEMEQAAEIFDSLGVFSQMMGLTSLNMGTVLGFYGVEVGLIVALGATMYSAVLSINIIAKESSQQTSEYLYSHPVSRFQIVSAKIMTVFIYISLMMLVCFGFALVTFVFLDESIPMTLLTRYHGLQWVMCLQIASICLMLSSFFKRENTGLGIGLVLILYFLSLIYNINSDWTFLGYISPFVYTDASYLLLSEPVKKLELGIGLFLMIIALVVTYYQMRRKDIN